MSDRPPSPSLPITTNILLLGAGELGTAFLPHLSTLPGIHTTVAVRTPSRYPHLRSPTTTLTELDLADTEDTLTSFFSSFDIIISATGFGQAPSTLLRLAHQVLRAGELRRAAGQPKLWFFPWQWGVDYDVTGDGAGLMPLFGVQKNIRDLLRERATGCHVNWTVVSTGMFMSFLFEAAWGVVMQTEGKVTVRALRDWEHRVTVTCVEDIGRVVARVVAGEVDAKDRVVYIAGDTVSYTQLADIIERIARKEIEREEWSLKFLEDEVKDDPEDMIKKYRLVFAREGVWWKKEGTVNKELGMQMVDVETYARRVFSTET